MFKQIDIKAKLLLIGLVAIALIYIVNKRLLKVKFDSMGNRIINESEIKTAFQKVSLQYGAEYARKVEQLFRKETAHFKSGQFLKTLSPGMEIAGGTNSTKTVFPFGWSSLQRFVSSNPKYAGNYYVSKMNENGTGFAKTFIGFPSMEASAMFVAWFIKNVRNNRFGYWYSMNESSALSYESNMKLITPRYV